MGTLMNEKQKDEFLKELKDEYPASDDQMRRQEADKEKGKKLQQGKKQRWTRECQRRGGTTQMFHLLSFCGRWDPSFLKLADSATQTGRQTEEQKKRTSAAVEARAAGRALS